MLKKLLSSIVAFVLIFSLIQIVPAYAEEYVEVKKNEAGNKLSEVLDKKTDTEDILQKIMEEQEKLMTPEIRASIRENAQKSLEGKNLKNKDFAQKDLKYSDYGFKTQAEFQKWLDEPFELRRISPPDGFSVYPTENAVKLGSSFSIQAFNYSSINTLHWYTAGDDCVSISYYGGNDHVRVTGTSIGSSIVAVADHGQPTVPQASCAVEVIYFDVGVTELYMKNGDTYYFDVSTSYTNSNTEIQVYNSNGIGVTNNSVTVYDAQGSFDATLFIYLSDRPTVGSAVTIHVINDPITLTIDQPVAEVYVGETTTLTATVTGTNNGVYWEGSNDYFTIGRFTGIISGLAPGAGISVATLQGYDLQRGLATHIYGISSLSATNITLLKGQSYSLTYNSYLPDNPPQVYYGINDTSIATMGYNGVITGANAGVTQAGVWVKDHNSTLKWCNVTVIEPTITIQEPNNTITQEDTGYFSATVSNPAYSSLVWSSSDSDIIRIDNENTGAYTATGFGTVTITATIPNSTVSQFMTINVLQREIIDYVSFKEKSKTIHVGERFMPEIETTTLRDEPIDIVFTCESDEGIISIDANGITGINAGSDFLCVKYGSSMDRMLIKVLPNDSDRAVFWDEQLQGDFITLESSTLSNRTYQRTASIYKVIDKSYEKINDKPVYSSSDSDIASVDQNGVVTAYKTGTVEITASTVDGNGKEVSAKYTVNVEGPPEPSGASLYRVPFEDVGGFSERVDDWYEALHNANETYPIGVYNGTRDGFVGMNEAEFCGAMASSKIFFFESHGMDDYLVIANSGDYITDQNIRDHFNIPTGGMSDTLSNTNMIIISACLTGYGSFGSALQAASPKILITMNKAVDSYELSRATDYFINMFFYKKDGKYENTVADVRAYLKHYKDAAGKDIKFVDMNVNGNYDDWTIEDIMYN